MNKIMFNDKYGLTQAVLEGIKTQTRRIAYTQNGFVVFDDEDFQLKKLDNDQALLMLRNNRLKTSRYKLGETIAIAHRYEDLLNDNEFYRLCGKNGMPLERIGFEKGYNNKMFVRSELMPHHIRINNIRVERLQDISKEDCLKEGIKRKNERYVIENERGVCFYTNDHILAFRFLIDKTSCKGTWASNPYVFVYDFELTKI